MLSFYENIVIINRDTLFYGILTMYWSKVPNYKTYFTGADAPKPDLLRKNISLKILVFSKHEI